MGYLYLVDEELQCRKLRSGLNVLVQSNHVRLCNG